MSTSISRQLSVKAKLELLLLLNVDDADELFDGLVNSEWKYASRLILSCQESSGCEPLVGVTDEAVALAVNNAELSAFVEHLFRGGDEPLCIPSVRPSAELIPTVVEAFREKPPDQHLSFRPLHLTSINGPFNFRFHKLWPDAADRRIRPCPYCSPQQVARSMDIDRYHFLHDRDELRLTVELTYLSLSRVRDAGRSGEVRNGRPLNRPYISGYRKLEFLRQSEIVEEVFRFAVRDDLDTFQLAFRHFCQFVDGRADALALRPIQAVEISFLLIRIKQAPRLTGPGDVLVAHWSQISTKTVLSLLHNGCALKLALALNPPPVLQTVLDEGVRFKTKMGELACFRESKHDLNKSLQLMATVGVRRFHLGLHKATWMRLLTSKALVKAAFVSCRVFADTLGPTTLNEIQQLVDGFLRNGTSRHVSFLMPPVCPIVNVDRLIERFLGAEKRSEFCTSLSVQLEFLPDGTPVPVQCRYPTLRNVIIPANVLVRRREESAKRFDVYHFRNPMINEHMTVFLGKRDDRNVGLIFIRKGCICVSEEDIAT